MDRDTAKIILGEWLSGGHQDDIGMIPPAEFGPLAPVVKMFRAGEKNPVKLARANNSLIGLDEISAMCAGKYEALYESAMLDYIDEFRARWLEDHKGAKPDEIVAFVEGTRREWMQQIPEAKTLIEVADEYTEVIDERKAKKTTMTGVASLDDICGGIEPGTLTAIGARPGTGKSAFCLQTAVNVARSGRKVLFFALEMTEAQNMDRLIMMHARGNVDPKKLRSGDLSEEDWQAVSEAWTSLGEFGENLMFSPERDITQIRRMIDKYQPDLCIIDQLSQLSDDTQTFTSVRERFSHMTKTLMDIVKTRTTAIWLACQVNRDANNQRPTLANLKESGSIEEDCDIVILMSRDLDEEERREMTTNRIIDVDVAKFRNGEPGYFQMIFNAKRFGFFPIERT